MSLTNLNQVTDFNINPNYNGSKHEIIVYYPHTVENDYAYMTIGRYSTKEQAIEVLDMIQNQYQYMMECKYVGVGCSQPEFIFVMPEDKGLF